MSACKYIDRVWQGRENLATGVALGEGSETKLEGDFFFF